MNNHSKQSDKKTKNGFKQYTYINEDYRTFAV